MQSTSDQRVIDVKPTRQLTSRVTIYARTRNAQLDHPLTRLRVLDRPQQAVLPTILISEPLSRIRAQLSVPESVCSSVRKKKRDKSRSVMSKRGKKSALITSSNVRTPLWRSKTSSAQAKTSNTSNSSSSRLSSSRMHSQSKRRSRWSTPCLTSSRPPTIIWRTSMSRPSRRKATRVMNPMTSLL